MMNVVIVGCGGVGSYIAEPLCRFLQTLPVEVSVTLVDGDTYEPKNRDRQNFSEFGNKADVTARSLQERFPGLAFGVVDQYLTDMTAPVVIPENAWIFSCVDNHASRKMLQDYCLTLRDAVLLSGGNEYEDGNVQVFVRRDGVNQTPLITHLHPEIENPEDKNPADMSCQEMAEAGTPQLIFTNLKVATEMLATFWAVLNGGGKAPPYSEVYFDLKTGTQRARKNAGALAQTAPVRELA